MCLNRGLNKDFHIRVISVYFFFLILNIHLYYDFHNNFHRESDLPSYLGVYQLFFETKFVVKRKTFTAEKKELWRCDFAAKKQSLMIF